MTGCVNWTAFEAISSTVCSVLTLLVILCQLYLLNKQKNIAKWQADLQRSSFVYDCFIREKQEKLIELRRKYMDFKDRCMYLLGTIFPGSVSPPEFDFFNPRMVSVDDKNLRPFYHKLVQEESSNTFLQNGEIASASLSKFLRENEVFLKDNPVLFDDLNTVSKAFNQLFCTINVDENKKSIFTALARFIDTVGENSYSFNDVNRQNYMIAMRSFLYDFLHNKIMLKRGDHTESMLSMPPGSIFKDLNVSRQEWSKNECIAFYTLIIFDTWFNKTWLKYIDDFFYVSFDEISRTIKRESI